MLVTNIGVRMNAIATWLLASYALLFVVTAFASRLRPIQSWQAERLATRVGLGVPHDLEQKICARVAGRMLGGALGGLVGLTAATIIMVATHAELYPFGFYAATAAAIAGYAAGLACASFSTVFEKDSRPRIARLTNVGLESYVPTSVRILAWVLLALAITTVLVATGWRHPERGLVLAPLLGVAALSLVALETLGRRLVDRGQAATTTDELVWDDALRSSSLNEVVYGMQQTVFVSIYGCAALSTASNDYWVFIPAGVLGIGIVLLNAMIRQARTWYLAELWPGSRRRTPEEQEARLASHA